jgi:hypothetical protein
LRPRSSLRHYLALALLAGLATAGCGPDQATVAPSTAVTPSAPATPAITTGPSAPVAASPSAPPSGSGAASAAPSGPGVRVDPQLLRVLPAQVDGVPLAPDPATAGQIAADASLPGFAEAIAVAFAFSSGASGDDFAIASVLRLRPGVFTEPWFSAYRNSYDGAACQVAGGVQGQSTATKLAGRTTYVGTCAGDAHTYHVHLADPTLIVSITAAGSRRFGELVVAGLAE